jgi:DNA-binding transcriptional regulator YiaG
MPKQNHCIFDFEKERTIRENLNLSRHTVAEYVNISERTLYYWETKGTGTNNLDAMNRMAILYDCYLDDFLKDGYILF